VKIERRISVIKALEHRWFSEDFQLYTDLLELEKKVKIKWLTNERQADKWLHSIKPSSQLITKPYYAYYSIDKHQKNNLSKCFL
jgi:hypothetical protein